MCPQRTQHLKGNTINNLLEGPGKGSVAVSRNSTDVTLHFPLHSLFPGLFLEFFIKAKWTISMCVLFFAVLYISAVLGIRSFVQDDLCHKYNFLFTFV